MAAKIDFPGGEGERTNFLWRAHPRPTVSPGSPVRQSPRLCATAHTGRTPVLGMVARWRAGVVEVEWPGVRAERTATGGSDPPALLPWSWRRSDSFKRPVCRDRTVVSVRQCE